MKENVALTGKFPNCEPNILQKEIDVIQYNFSPQRVFFV